MSDAMLSKIRKLLAKAEDPGCTPAEAEALTAKASELIAAYGIDQARLDEDQPRRAAGVINRMIVIHNPYAIDKIQLLSRVGQALRCEVLRVTNPTVDYLRGKVYGYESDVDRVEILFTSLLVQSANAMAQTTVPYTARSTVSFRKSWMAGYTQAIYDRLRQAEARAEDTDRSQHGAGTDLMLVRRTQAVSQAVSDEHPDIPTAKAPPRTPDGIHAGYAAGMMAHLGTTELGNTTSDRRALS